MAGFVVMERGRGGAPESDGARTQFAVVRDRFSFIAFVLPVVWLLWHRLWIEAAVALAAALLLAWLGSLSGYGTASTFLSLIVAIYVGVEGPALRLAALRRRGWRDWGVVEADNATDAELRYLAEKYGAEDALEEPAAPPAWQTQRHAATRSGSVPAVGLLSYPDGR